MKKIVILGQSEKFTRIVHSLFDDADIITIPWRGCIDYIDLVNSHPPDLVVVCGYDYGSSLYAFKDYIDVNVNWPYQTISALCVQKTRIMYIDTEHGISSVTFSRYQYAKNLLAQRILSGFKNVQVLSIPTVANAKGEADIKGGLLTKLIFNFFIKVGLVRIVYLHVLQRMFFDAFETDTQIRLTSLTPKLLAIRRTLFIDRMLRFVCG